MKLHVLVHKAHTGTEVHEGEEKQDVCWAGNCLFSTAVLLIVPQVGLICWLLQRGKIH